MNEIKTIELKTNELGRLKEEHLYERFSALLEIPINEIDFFFLERLGKIKEKLDKDYKGKKIKDIEDTLDKYTSHLLDLEDNWDGQGASSYKLDTIQRTKRFVRAIMDYFTDQRIEISIPKVLPVPNGSLDISWKNNYYRLIINISEDPHHLVEVYGDVTDHPEDEIDLRLNYDILIKGGVLVEWLKKTLRYGR